MKFTFIIALIFVAGIFAQSNNALIPAERIADQIIRETSFAFTETPQRPADEVQVIDFNLVAEKYKTASVKAVADISVDEDKILQFGVSSQFPVKILVNNKIVFTGKKNQKFLFKEIAYSVYIFQDTFCVKLHKGLNGIIVEPLSKKQPVAYLCEISRAEQPVYSKFLPVDSLTKNYTWPWSYYDGKSGFVPAPVLLKKLIISQENTFKKDSFADWNYPNGILMMAMGDLSDASGNQAYQQFVEKYCAFINDNIPLFRYQYFRNHDLRGSYYRIFRKGMLDDAGSPVLPFVQSELINKNKVYDSLINAMASYVVNEQFRLSDGILCRPEPVKWTVWADDLFMTVPLLLRLGKLQNNDKYYEEAGNQILNFNKYLFDKDLNLYTHGWFSSTGKRSTVFWGRANGWILWAESEAIKYLPKENKNYKNIEYIFTNHLKGILSCQDKNGMWHQVLDDEKSFKETSCTAMFIIALSRGITSGIINKNYSSNIFKAWNALKENIDSNGIVKNICCGTGIGPDKEFYENRKRYDNDPRGLGAVITAAIEIDNLEKYLKGTE